MADKRAAQLKLIHAEVDRQRAAIAARRTSFHTRAAVLVTATGILAAIQSTSWVSGWQYVSIGLTVLAASFGLFAMRPQGSAESDPASLYENALDRSAYDVEDRIVADNITALTGELRMLGGIAKPLRIGYYVLVAAWISMVAVAELTQYKII